MNILLIHPPSANPLLDQVYMHEPLALEYLGAGLKQDGHQVEVFDARIEQDFIGAFRRQRPQLVGRPASPATSARSSESPKPSSAWTPKCGS